MLGSQSKPKLRFLAALTNHLIYTPHTTDIGFVIVTEDAGAGMVDAHVRRPCCVKPGDPVEKAAYSADKIVMYRRVYMVESGQGDIPNPYTTWA
jgi:hypothetical protein